MSTIKEGYFNEEFSTKLIKFSNDGFDNIENAKDGVNGFVMVTKESLKNKELHKNLEDDKITAQITEDEEKKRDVIDKETCSKYNISLNNKEGHIHVDSNVKDDTTNEEKELMCKDNPRDIEVEKNHQSEHNNILDNADSMSSYFVENLETMKDKVNINEVLAIDDSNDSNTSESKIQSTKHLEHAVSVNTLRTNNEKQNSQNNDIIIVDTHDDDDVTLTSSNIKTAVIGTTEIPIESFNNTAKNEDNSNSKNFSEPKINAPQSNIEGYDEGSPNDIEQMNVLESGLCTEKNSASTKVGNDESDDTNEITMKDVQEENLAETEQKLDSENRDEKKKMSLACTLSNHLDLISDDEDEKHKEVHNIENLPDKNEEKQCINLVDDDEIMLVEESVHAKHETLAMSNQINVDELSDKIENMDTNYTTGNEISTDTTKLPNHEMCDNSKNVNLKPLLPPSFLKNSKKKLAEMSREELEKFCILNIVESVVERSSLRDINTQLKNMTLILEKQRRKTHALIKQNRDLRCVINSIKEDHKKASEYAITPKKITRSVGMQVLMADKPNGKRKNAPLKTQNHNQSLPLDKSNNNAGTQKPQKNLSQPIPTPRLVPAPNTMSNKPNTTQFTNTSKLEFGKSSTSNAMSANGIKNSLSPAQKPEKRTRVQSVTVDLTDDEPPLKVTSGSSPSLPPVRLVPTQQLLAVPRPQIPTTLNGSRKVYIPISGTQGQNTKTWQPLAVKSLAPSAAGPKQKSNNNNVNKVQLLRTNRMQYSKHPAPLPEVMRHYQPPNWKALPPAPNISLTKAENGVQISWTIEGYQKHIHEEIRGYHLFAYQETQSPPNTATWKKIGEVKALPLPMACTLTLLTQGYKYHFAVRAVDVKARCGPFSEPEGIVLLNTG